ncbi:hypothetical protein PG987_004269 [Apiospora arundinis]
MQDDEQEKTADIMQMDEVYSNSSLNISAAEGRVREGLDLDRNTLYINPHRAKVRHPITQEDIHLQAFRGKSFLGPREAPLNKRGWVFQERILAPRVVHFTQDQVFWECSSLEASEVLPRGISRWPRKHFTKGIMDPSIASMQQIKSRWFNIVEDYSHTSLTFTDDHLLAISAVAKKFCSALQREPSDYLAGMWKDDLPLSMLWMQHSQPDTDMLEPTAAAEMNHAPSWSWASILGPIMNVEPSSLTASAEVLNVQAARMSPNLFDGTESCRLRLRGHVCKFCRCTQNGARWINVAQHTEFQEISGFEFQKGRTIVIDWDTSRKMADEWLQTPEIGLATFEYFLLHLASEKGVDGTLERGIVLRKTNARGTFSRVGSFFTPPQSEYSGSKLEAALTGRLVTLSTDDYFDLDFNGKYIVEVV